MITHANVMATMRNLTSLIELGPDDRFLSFLPLSHITERSISHFGQIVSRCRDLVRPQHRHHRRGPAGVPADDALRRAPGVGEVPGRRPRAHQQATRRRPAPRRRYFTVATARAADGGIVPNVEYQVLDRGRREHDPPPARPRPCPHRRLRSRTGPSRPAALVPRHRPARSPRGTGRPRCRCARARTCPERPASAPSAVRSRASR